LAWRPKSVSRADERHFVRRAEENQLQRQLRDLICLAVVGDHVRWVVTGDDELVDWLAQATGEWRKWADRVAKQLTASGVAPDGRVRSLAKDISLNWVPDGWLSADQAQRLVSERLAVVAGWARSRHSLAYGADAELLEVVSEGLEVQLRARRNIAPAQRGNHERHASKIARTAAEKSADRARVGREKVST
jgi:DNA-binding ferritin-like protein